LTNYKLIFNLWVKKAEGKAGYDKLSPLNNKESPSPTIAIAVYIDKANPMPRNWEKEE